MSEFDEQKYKLDRISALLDSYRFGWVNKRSSLFSRFGNLQRLNDRERNPIMAVCGSALPILLVIFSMEAITISELINYLIIDFVIMLAIFFFYAIYNYENNLTNAKIETVLLDSIQNLETLKIHLNETSFDIKQFNNENLDILYAVTKITQGDSNLRYFNILKSLMNKKLLHLETKKQFQDIVESGKKIIDQDIQYYKLVKDTINEPEWKDFSYLYEQLANESKLSKN